MFARGYAGRSAARRRLGQAIGRFGGATLLAILGIFAGSMRGEAATISTYSFFQDGYADPGNFVGTATVQGSFTGSVEPSGIMNSAGLTAFQLTLTLNQPNGSFQLHSSGMPSFFSFDTLSSPNPSGGNSTFALAVALANSSNTLCIGVATPFICGRTANGGFTVYGLTTMNFAQLTLVPPTVTPIPAPVLLFATALAGLGLLGARARRLPRAA